MRVWNWVERLNEVIRAAQHGELQFDYGAFNCGLFVARCADAMSETSQWEDELRSHFTDEASAKAYVATNGGLEALVSARLGESQPWWLTRRGDVGTVDTPFGPAVGICTGEAIACLTLTGVTFVRLDRARKCWAFD